MRVGDVIEVKEADYKYGVGTLTITLTWVEESPDEWVEVRGTSPHWQGERWALIRRAGAVVIHTH